MTLPKLTFTSEPFGAAPDGQTVIRFTLTNAAGMTVQVLTYGGIIESIRVPDRRGVFADVVLGYDSLDGYLRKSPYFGAIVGRYANRIAHGTFTLDTVTYHLALNKPPNAIHGGIKGFDKVVWDAEPFQHDSAVGVVLHHTSPDGDQGYPGTLQVRVTYTLLADNHLRVEYHATTNRATPINLTQHSYCNLSGGTHDILDDVLMINADEYTPIDSTMIPTGDVVPVAGTPFNFRQPIAIGARINEPSTQLQLAGGYDHNFVLNQRGDSPGLAARLADPATGRVLTVYTTQPGLQLYTGNGLDGSITGAGGHRYQRHWGVALETQHFPDSVNHPQFPSTILRQGEEFESTTVFAFSVTE